MKIEVEFAKYSDLEEINNLYFELTNIKSDLNEMQKRFEKYMSDSHYKLLVARLDDNHIVGTVLGIICESLSENCCPFFVIENVIVNSNFRRKGIGKMLLNKLDEIAQENSCTFSFLVSGKDRIEAHTLYKNSGYTDPVVGFRKFY